MDLIGTSIYDYVHPSDHCEIEEHCFALQGVEAKVFAKVSHNDCRSGGKPLLFILFQCQCFNLYHFFAINSTCSINYDVLTIFLTNGQ